MAYLLPAEYAEFGLSEETADAWVVAASAMIDAHCKRASLLVTNYTERMRVGERQRVVLSYGPVSAVTAARAKYATLTERLEGFVPFQEFVAGAFGLTGQWIDVDVTTLDVDAATGEVAFGHALGLRYSDVEITYTAGLAVVPDAVKVACAQVVKNAQATPGLNVKSTKMDTLQTEYFSDSLIDSQVQALLRPYVAERLGG
ncbi:hypothetical protein ACFQBQ_11405 [Granulicella cerasi]|uniref:PhiE125 gp8 family phage protein n=1 Tax=Granulicella cerasi TaxID=741063 RepID=A0ABW1ZC25_9BACT|nr:hypothetical protein [Granulicella cerasi]